MLLAALAAFGLFLLPVRKRLPAQAMVLWGVAVALGLVGAVALSACSSSGGGGGKKKDEAAAETYEMSKVDSGDSNYKNGALYEVKVKIEGDARTLKYRFDFSDGDNAAIGHPALDQTLTVK